MENLTRATKIQNGMLVIGGNIVFLLVYIVVFLLKSSGEQSFIFEASHGPPAVAREIIRTIFLILPIISIASFIFLFRGKYKTAIDLLKVAILFFWITTVLHGVV